MDREEGSGRPSSAPAGLAHSGHASAPHRAGPGSRVPADDAAAVDTYPR